MAQPDLGDAGGNGEAEPSRSAPIRREPVADVQEAPSPQDEDREEEPAAEEDHDEPAEEDRGGAGRRGGARGRARRRGAARRRTRGRPAAAGEPHHRRAPRDRRPADRDVRRRGGVRRHRGADPSDEELVAEEITEPRLAPAEPLDALAADDAGAARRGGASERGRGRRRLLRRAAPLRRARPGSGGPARARVRGNRASRPQRNSRSREETESCEADSRGSRAAGRPPADEDVLEETPDFLEEAPEDDQLWFEQKPPKDFDFDD